jgi:CRISPR-associated protein Cmr4
MNKSRTLYIFTRTPLHVGAGASVGAIDQPIIRERHTGFPIIPASSLKGTFADAWNDGLLEESNAKGEKKKVRVGKDGNGTNAAWLFGSDSDQHAAAGALQFTEASLLAFPIRSAKGSFAWITCPLMLRRAVRDGVITADCLPTKIPTDEQALFASTVPDGIQQMPGPLRLDVQENGQPVKKIVLEEYTFTWANDLPANLGTTLATLVAVDPVWQEVASRLVILSDGMMSFFSQNACEVAQHVKISDETGTAEGGALFNQENVPSEALFYSVLHAFDERTANKPKDQLRDGGKAIEAFETKIKAAGVFQFGGDASTGLGYCTVKLS